MHQPDGSITSDNLPLSEVNSADALIAVDCNSLVRSFLQASLSENTQRAIASDVRHFLASDGTVPSTPPAVAAYLASCGGQLSVTTLTRRISSLRRAHWERGFPDPTRDAVVRNVLRGIARVQLHRRRKVQPITTELLKQLLGNLKDGPRDSRDRLILLLGFGAALRRSEIAALDFADVLANSESLQIRLGKSKSDQFGEGTSITVAATKSADCILKAYENWGRFCEKAGPLFRAISKSGRVSGNRLSGEAVARIIKGRVGQIGCDPALFSGHSLRAGLATAAARIGIPLDQIQSHTRHCSIDSVLDYVRPAGLFDESHRNIGLLP